MESKEYFEKVIQYYNQNRNGRSLRKYVRMKLWIMIGSLNLRRAILSVPRSKRCVSSGIHT